jgi:tetratricopeptide (TPR) repeat protein
MADDATRVAGQTGTAGPGRTGAGEIGELPAGPPGYELLQEIGHGGMGVVYRACDISLRRDVAVKLLSDRCPPDSPAAQRFLNEARITGQLQHPGIPAVHQVGTLPDGRPFLAMKLIKGETLDSILKQRTDPSADRSRMLAIFEAVCQAVGYAHAHRVIHRDLKPNNVMVGAFGEVQVMDWGLAKVLGEEAPATVDLLKEQTAAWTDVGDTQGGSHTEAGSVMGTPAYMPPEQAVGQIERVNQRSDVFGLGAILAVILTGKPPYLGKTFDSVRLQAVGGRLEDCFSRLDASGAEPELVALCKQCLAFEPADRQADAGMMAASVAELRAAADERARRAELERVRVEGEQATALARAAERRKRRRMAIGAAAVLTVAVVGGLLGVLQVQRRANADLAVKNAALADEQAKVEARFETALKAIATLYTGVSQDVLLRNEEFSELRTKLLKEAASFYEELEKLLEAQTDAKSRRMLAAAYSQLGDLTEKIGARPQALAVQRQALAVRRELAAAPGADAEARLNVAHSLRAVGRLLYLTGDPAGALAAWEEQRDIAAALQAESPTDAARALLAQSYYSSGHVLGKMGKPADALATEMKGREIRQQLADANAGVAQFQSDLADSHYIIGTLLKQAGKPAEALEAFQKGLDILQHLVDGNPAVTAFQLALANSYDEIGGLLSDLGKPAKGMETLEKAVAIRQNLAELHPAVTEFQRNLAKSFNDIGYRLRQTGKPAEALAYYKKAVAIQQKLADTHTKDPHYQGDLANTVASLGALQRGDGHPASAATFFRQAIGILERLPTRDPVDLYNLACCDAMLAGVAADPGSGMTAAEALAAADKAMAALRDAVAAGYRNVAGMRSDPDLAVLRPRADFQQLMKELEPKSP